MKAIFLPFGIKVKHKDENKQQEEDKKWVKVSFNLGSLLLAELKKDVRDIFLQAQIDALGTTKLYCMCSYIV